MKTERNVRSIYVWISTLHMQMGEVAGCTSALAPRSAVCPTEREMEPQITPNTQRAAVPYRARTMR